MFEKERELVKPYKDIDWDSFELPSCGEPLLNMLKSFRDKKWNEAFLEGNLYQENVEVWKVEALCPLLEQLGISITFSPEDDYPELPDWAGSKLEAADLYGYGPPSSYTVYIGKNDYLKLKNLHFRF